MDHGVIDYAIAVWIAIALAYTQFVYVTMSVISPSMAHMYNMVSCLAYSLTLKMETTCSSQMLVDF
jgi:hypothetical protein